jgi:hypothetical protein
LTRRSLQSRGKTFSLTEVANTSGYEACLSVPIVKGRRRCPALISLLKKRFAAETSRLALSMNSIVYPVESTARYKYFHSVPALTYVSSRR